MLRNFFASRIGWFFAFFVSLSFYYMLGPLCVNLFDLLTNYSSSLISSIIRINTYHLCLALGIFVSLKMLLFIPFGKAISDTGRFRTTMFLTGLIPTLILYCIYLWIEMSINPSQYAALEGQGINRLFILPLLLILTPIQTGAEEITYRLFPLRIAFDKLWCKTIKTKLSASFVLALLFTFIHLRNREVALSNQVILTLSYYFIFGFGATFITLDTGGLEAAFGLHLANNLYTTIICNYVNSTLPSIPFFLKAESTVSLTDLGTLIVTLSVVLIITRVINNRKSDIIRKY